MSLNLFQAREHCMSLLETALRDNYVKYYQEIPTKMAAKDYEPRICAIDLEHEVFKGMEVEHNKHSEFVIPPTSEKLRGHIGLGLSVRLSIHLSVHNTWQLRNSRTAYARILKFYMWHVHEK